jgi:hypothetical protein
MRIATVGLVSLLLCAAPAVAGCGGSDGGTSGAPSPSASRSAPSASASADPPSPAATATRTSPTSRTSPAPSGLAGRLLPASAVAGLTDGYRWRDAGTGTGEPKRLFGTCQRFAMTSIGAERVAVRHYLPARAALRKAGDHAGELVAAFPDETTARRAFDVLRAWRGRCAERLPGHQSSGVGDLQDVPVTGGSGGWYLLTYGPVKGHPGARYLDAQGIAVVGSRIAVLSMVEVGEDHDYEPGHEPMVGTLRRAAGLLR